MQHRISFHHLVLNNRVFMLLHQSKTSPRWVRTLHWVKTTLKHSTQAYQVILALTETYCGIWIAYGTLLVYYNAYRDLSDKYCINQKLSSPTDASCCHLEHLNVIYLCCSLGHAYREWSIELSFDLGLLRHYYGMNPPMSMSNHLCIPCQSSTLCHNLWPMGRGAMLTDSCHSTLFLRSHSEKRRHPRYLSCNTHPHHDTHMCHEMTHFSPQGPNTIPSLIVHFNI